MTSHVAHFTSGSWTKILPTIFRSNIHADVFLQCEGKRIAVHKTILASQSSFLRQILSSAEPSVQIPVILLEGFRYDVLLLLVNFIYNGRVEGTSEDLIALSKYGKELQIEGLINSGRSTQPLQLEVLEQRKDQVNKQLHQLQDSHSDSEDIESCEEDELTIVFEKSQQSEEKAQNSTVQASSDSSKRPLSPTSCSPATVKKKCQKVPSSGEKAMGSKDTETPRFKCRTCRQLFTCKDAFYAHLSEKHADILTCSICGKLLTTRSSLKTHLKNHISKLDNMINTTAAVGQLATVSPVKDPATNVERSLL